MAKETKTLKENDDIRIDATAYKGENGKKEFFSDVMDRVRDLVVFHLSLKVSAAFSIYSKKHNSEVTDVTFKVGLCESAGCQFFDNIELNKPYRDQEFLYSIIAHVASSIADIIKESDNVYEDLLNVLLVTQNVLVAETVVYINDEPITDAIVEHLAAMKNRTLN